MLFAAVAHTPQYFDQNWAELDELIRKSALVVLEHFRPEYHDFDPAEPPSGDFYWFLSELAGSAGKKVAVFGP